MKSNPLRIPIISFLVIILSIYLISCTNSRFAQTSSGHLEYVKKDPNITAPEKLMNVIPESENELSASADEAQPVVVPPFISNMAEEEEGQTQPGYTKPETAPNPEQGESTATTHQKIHKASQSPGGGWLSATVNTLAVLALIFGILALVTYYGSFLFALLAIIFGVIALNQGGGGEGMAIAGLVLGIIGASVWAIIIASRNSKL